MKLLVQQLVIVIILMSQTSFSQTLDQTKLGVKMKQKALMILSELNSEQKNLVQYSFDAKEKTNWRYFPSPKSKSMFPEHSGLKMELLNESQEQLVLDLVSLAMSPTGLDLITAARLADSDPEVSRKLLHKMLFNYGKENYFISFFGSPSSDQWMFRFQGHHISININIEKDEIISASPSFLGTNPSEYEIDGRKVHLHENLVNTLKVLLSSMSNEQLIAAGNSLKKVPKDLLYAPSLFGVDQTPNGKLPSGLSVTQMTPEQQQKLAQMVMSYLNYFNPEVSVITLSKIKKYGLENVEFIFTGDSQMNEIYYWRIQGPSFVFEFGCGDERTDHFHVSWIDLK